MLPDTVAQQQPSFALRPATFAGGMRMTHGNVGRPLCIDIEEQRPNDTNANGDRPEIRRPKKTFLNCGRTSPTRVRSTMMHYYRVLIVENVTVTTVVNKTGRLIYNTRAGRSVNSNNNHNHKKSKQQRSDGRARHSSTAHHSRHTRESRRSTPAYWQAVNS